MRSLAVSTATLVVVFLRTGFVVLQIRQDGESVASAAQQVLLIKVSAVQDGRPGDGLYHRMRKCADTVGTVLVPRSDHFQCPQYKYIFQIKYTEAILSNSTRKRLWIEITEVLIAVKK